MSIASSRPGAVAPTLPPTNVDSSFEQSRGSGSIQISVQQQGQVDLETGQVELAHYLQNHEDWISRCFKPLKVEPLALDFLGHSLPQDDPSSPSVTGHCYRLQFFKIGGLGFELEPSFGVRIWQESDRMFRLSSIKLPSDEGLPYTVGCQAYFGLEQLAPDSEQLQTRVHWRLDLDIYMTLPRFLQALPRPMVYRVGSNVVSQVTRSMSDRLTHNVCKDFYRSIGKPNKPYRLVHTSSNVATDAPAT